MKLSERMVSEYLRSNTANPEWIDAAILLEAAVGLAKTYYEITSSHWSNFAISTEEYEALRLAASGSLSVALAALDAARNTEE